MRFYPTRPQGQFLSFLLVCLILILSCSKDSDLLNDAIFNGASESVEDREKTEDSTDSSEVELPEETPTASQEAEEETPIVAEDPNALQEGFESRTTSFPPIHDAHFQSGKSFNQHIIRLEEDNRTSYLMFDLGQIDTIGGHITEAKLQFTISSDDGDGTINVYKGQSVDWTENDLTSVPEVDVQLGS